VTPHEMRAKALNVTRWCGKRMTPPWRAGTRSLASNGASWQTKSKARLARARQVHARSSRGSPGPSLPGVLPLWTQAPLSGHKNRNALPRMATASRASMTIVIRQIYHETSGTSSIFAHAFQASELF
jgi:hypothetical protein